MPDETASRRERRKLRTRRAISDAAVRQFAEQGVDATTIESICEEADVAVSTFYVYFPSKEATAFPGADDRAALVEGTLGDRPDGEPLHVALRRAAHAVVAEDLRDRAGLLRRIELMAREPALAAYAARLQADYVDRIADQLAAELSEGGASSLRARLAVSALFGALGAAWSAWSEDTTVDLHALVDQAHDLLDAGLERMFTT